MWLWGGVALIGMDIILVEYSQPYNLEIFCKWTREVSLPPFITLTLR